MRTFLFYNTDAKSLKTMYTIDNTKGVQIFCCLFVVVCCLQFALPQFLKMPKLIYETERSLNLYFLFFYLAIETQKKNVAYRNLKIILRFLALCYSAVQSIDEKENYI